MTYFQNIHSLTDLKKKYRRLALQHHPDKGGDTAVMQQANAESEKLYDVWKDSTNMSADITGYEYDCSGATVKEYAEYVYNKYRWKGRNYKGQHAPEIVEPVRIWLKETYPRYRFSVRRENYSSTYIKLMSADLEALTKESGKVQDTISHYNIEWNPDLTDRAKEVVVNVCDFVVSYNLDDSSAMTDYFHTDFYLTLSMGSYRKPYKAELSKLVCKGKKKQEVFKHPEDTAHKVLRQALGTARFDFIEYRKHIGEMILGGDHYGSQGEHCFWPKEYLSVKTTQRRVDKLEQAGIQCRLIGYNGGYIQFLGHTPETKTLLEQGREEVTIAHQAWQARRIQTD